MLSEKRIIVTGAAQGIGAVLASGFAKMGAMVAFADIADPSAAAEGVRANGGRAIPVKVDVTRLDDCVSMVEATEDAFGGVDGLVCNAALFAALPLQGFDQIEENLWNRVMDVNVKGPWHCTRAVAPAMERAGGGSIVMISSNRVFRGFPDLLHYDASKGAVLSMTRSLTRELGSRNIRVNTIAPGLTLSEGVLARAGIEDRMAAVVANRALSRDQRPEDLVGPTAFLLSDHSAFVAGQSLIVDGGGIVN